MNNEQLSERANFILRRLNFFDNFVIVDPQEFTKQGRNCFSEAYEDTVRNLDDLNERFTVFRRKH